MIKKLGFHPDYSYNMIWVFCGYDDLLIGLARKFKNSNIVGNDLSWKELLMSGIF